MSVRVRRTSTMKIVHRIPLPTLLVTAIALGGCPADDPEETGGNDESSTTSDDPSGDPTTMSATEPTSTAPTTTTPDPDSSSSGDEPTTGEPTDTTDTDSTESTGEPVVCKLEPGAVWAAPDWETTTVDALAVRAALDALVGDALMRGNETGAVEFAGIESLEAAWNGTPSLADAANPEFATLVGLLFEEFVQIMDAGEQDLIDPQLDWDPGAAGGVWGDADRGINEGGLEVRQFIDKGAFGGGLNYAWAAALTEGEISPDTVDAIAAIWGNNATLDPMGMPALTDGANYSYQMGFHATMAAALADAKHFAGDPACGAERDAALVVFFNNWEQSMLARTIFYGNRAAGKLLDAETDTQFADVLHDLGEGLGLAAGYVGFPDPASGPLAGAGRIITDEQAIEILEAYGVDVATPGASTTGLLLESLPNLETANETAQGVMMDVYGVDAGTIQTYLMPTAG